MQILRKKVSAVLLSMVMALTMLVALPTAAYAADIPPSISNTTKYFDVFTSPDVEFTVDLGDGSLAATGIDSVTDGNVFPAVPLTPPTDYTFTSPDTLTIKGSYLSDLCSSLGIGLGDYAVLVVKFDDLDFTPVTLLFWIGDSSYPAICKIMPGGGLYNYLPFAIYDVKDGETIELVDDVTLSRDLYIFNSKTFTLDTAGKKLDFAGNTMGISDDSKVTFDGCGTFDNLRYIGIIDSGTRAVFNGNIKTDEYTWVGLDAEAVFNGSVTVLDEHAIRADSGSTVTVAGNIIAGRIGVYAEDGSTVTVIGNITAGEAGVFAKTGATVTVDGTITAPYYIAFFTDDITVPFKYITASDNTIPSMKDGYYQYDDKGEFGDTAFVWVKAPETSIPGTGDNTAKWLMLGALMVAALGTSAFLVYKRRQQQD